MDLISQRQLVAVIKNKAHPYSMDDLRELCPQIEERLRLINRLEQPTRALLDISPSLTIQRTDI